MIPYDSIFRSGKTGTVFLIEERKKYFVQNKISFILSASTEIGKGRSYTISDALGYGSIEEKPMDVSILSKRMVPKKMENKMDTELIGLGEFENKTIGVVGRSDFQ